MNRVINIQAADAEAPDLFERRPEVTTLVIGDSPTTSDAEQRVVPALPSFETDYKNLERLNLWSLGGVSRVPRFGSSLRVLEVRSCPDLVSIDNLPTSLEMLILENCGKLSRLPTCVETWTKLRELSLAGCENIDAAWINELIRKCPELEFLDISRCRQVQELPATLPTQLKRLELNECDALKLMPANLPLELRRLGLRKADALTMIPDLPQTADYVDLAFTKRLERLPRFPDRDEAVPADQQRPRTLYLYGSGVLEPPASEQGLTPSTNVAMDTREYYDEVDLVGRGNVRRCKLLLLGNGLAGKTCLALNLNPDYSYEQHYTGSTHGVQFWDWPTFEARGERSVTSVNLHMWDFGGQEIYHSTHRLFVSRGAVFLVVWNPAQDGRIPDPVDGIQDSWFPLRYWLDYIHTECPHNRPLVAVVCSHQGDASDQRKQELQRLYRDQLKTTDYADRIPLFVFDSWHNLGEKELLSKWLVKSVAEVVSTQGTVVPTYWEIAQGMVERWLPKAHSENGDKPEAKHSRLAIEDFAAALKSEIDKTLQQGSSTTDLSKLKRNWNDGAFLLPDDDQRRLHRVHRTLRFLTRSGWLYWDPDLFESRVIIDQAWALERVYMTLQRDPNTAVYPRLINNQGRFQFSDLQQWCWSGEIDESDQRLILSFMKSVGVIFQLTRHWHGDEPVYLSPAHLPNASTIAQLDPEKFGPIAEITVCSEVLHRGHWFEVMRKLCEDYGDAAVYAKDACLIRGSTYRWNREYGQWKALFRFQLDDELQGLGGKVHIHLAGEEIGDRKETLKRLVESRLPRFEGNPDEVDAEYQRELHGPVENAKTIFFSYAWDPVEKQIADFEEPVNAVFAALEPHRQHGLLRLWRDKTTMEPGDYISEFVGKAKSPDVDLVIIFTSEKYWKSWWCMLEFAFVMDSLRKSGKGIDKSVLLIEHESGKLLMADQMKPIVDHWRGMDLEAEFPDDVPRPLLDLNLARLRDRFLQLIQQDSGDLTFDALDIRREWKSENAKAIIDWVTEKVLPTDEN